MGLVGFFTCRHADIGLGGNINMLVCWHIGNAGLDFVAAGGWMFS